MAEVRVVAVRDDGALLVQGGGQCYIFSGDGVFPMSCAAALARGVWKPGGDTAVPKKVADLFGPPEVKR